MNIIQEKRSLLGMNQSEFSNLLGVERSTISKWETGKSLPRAELLPKIAQILNCSVDELLRGECASDGSSEKEKLQADTC